MARFLPTKFSIDSISDSFYEGYADGSNWNGFARPYFEHETALRVLCDSESNGFRWRYDEAQDVFLVESMAQPEDDPEEFYGQTIDVDGKQIRLYPIGAGSWIWSEAEGD